MELAFHLVQEQYPFGGFVKKQLDKPFHELSSQQQHEIIEKYGKLISRFKAAMLNDPDVRLKGVENLP